MNKYEEEFFNNKDNANLGISIVSDSTSNIFGNIITLNKEIDDICKLCKYGKKHGRTDMACYSCGDKIKLTQYYR